MLFSDLELFGAEQTDILTALDEISAEQHAAPLTAGIGVRYHGSQSRAHGEGYVVSVRADGRLNVRIHRPDQVDPWYPLGFQLRAVRPESVTRLDAKAAA